MPRTKLRFDTHGSGLPQGNTVTQPRPWASVTVTLSTTERAVGGHAVDAGDLHLDDLAGTEWADVAVDDARAVAGVEHADRLEGREHGPQSHRCTASK